MSNYFETEEGSKLLSNDLPEALKAIHRIAEMMDDVNDEFSELFGDDDDDDGDIPVSLLTENRKVIVEYCNDRVVRIVGPYYEHADIDEIRDRFVSMVLQTFDISESVSAGELVKARLDGAFTHDDCRVVIKSLECKQV